MKALKICMTGLLLLAGVAFSQDVPPPEPPARAVLVPGGPARGEFLFVQRMDREVVKGAPYTATATTESTQVLADGNRIVHKQSGLVARDGEGRTRREETMGRMGPLAVEGAKIIFVRDPVAKTAYLLNPDKEIARVIRHDGPPDMKVMEMRGKLHDKVAARLEAGELKTESLGKQQIEGLSVEGKRVTRTIPAGAIGNEQPITIAVETWTSPELHTMVLQKRNDPRFGETVFRLTNIKRGEPDAALFQVPGGYKTVDEPLLPKVRALERRRTHPEQ